MRSKSKLLKPIIATILLISGFVAHAEVDQSLRKDLDDVSPRFLQNKVFWTGDYTGYVDSFYDVDRSKDQADYTPGRLRHRLRLGLKATPNEYFRFSGRLAAYKNFGALEDGDPDVRPDATNYSLRPSSDAKLRIDRMYMDIFPSYKWISGSIGLFPSTEGMPSDLFRLQPRKSTYPNLLFDAPFAGVIAALHPTEIFDALPESHFWFIYSSTFDPRKTNALGYNVEDPTKFAVKNVASVMIWHLEVAPKVPFAREWKNSISYGRVDNIHVDEDQLLLPYLNGYLGVSVTPGAEIGGMDRLVLLSQAEGIANTGFNYFISIAASQLVGSNPTNTNVSNTTAPALLGITGSIHKENSFGKAYYTGLSYDFKTKLGGYFGAPTVGYDFMFQEKSFLSYYLGGDDITGRFQNPGVSHKFFYTQPVTDYMKLHLAYTYYMQKYTTSLYEAYAAPGSANLTNGIDVNSVSRAGRILHLVQLAFVMGF